MAWRSMGCVLFSGGTASLSALKGRRVRLRPGVTLTAATFLGEGFGPGPRLMLLPLAEGLVGLPVKDLVVVAFPHTRTTKGLTLERLKGGQFDSILVNEPTLRMQFEIDD